MGELVSMWPTAGGQYHWTYQLAEGLGLEKYKALLSYVTGWYVYIPFLQGGEEGRED
jgi:choline transport protein